MFNLIQHDIIHCLLLAGNVASARWLLLFPPLDNISFTFWSFSDYSKIIQMTKKTNQE